MIEDRLSPELRNKKPMALKLGMSAAYAICAVTGVMGVDSQRARSFFHVVLSHRPLSVPSLLRSDSDYSVTHVCQMKIVKYRL